LLPPADSAALTAAVIKQIQNATRTIILIAILMSDHREGAHHSALA
jgi:hypothetical protein